jgi:hypothetical protein
MPRPPVTPEIAEFLARPNPAVMATLRPDGSPHTAATWYVWEDGRVHVNMDRSRKRLANVRNDPRVSLIAPRRRVDRGRVVVRLGLRPAVDRIRLSRPFSARRDR